MPQRNMYNVEDFSSRLEVVPYDHGAVFHYGHIKADLGLKGTAIEGNDFILQGMQEIED